MGTKAVLYSIYNNKNRMMGIREIDQFWFSRTPRPDMPLVEFHKRYVQVSIVDRHRIRSLTWVVVTLLVLPNEPPRLCNLMYCRT